MILCHENNQNFFARQRAFIVSFNGPDNLRRRFFFGEEEK
jgi:hypothetical protein